MMNTFNYHYKAIIITFNQLVKGNFLLYFIPGIAITVTYFGFQYYLSTIKDSLLLSSDYSIIDWLFGWINYGIEQGFKLFDFLFKQIYIFLVLTLLSPFNTFLAENLDSELTKSKFKSSFQRFIKDILRMFLIVFVALSMELGFFIIYWMFSWAFGLELIDDIVYFCITSFFFGFAFYDYGLERYQINLGGSIEFAFKHPISMLLTGAIFLLLYNIPYIGIPIAPVLTVMISTIVYLYITKKIPENKIELKKGENE